MLKAFTELLIDLPRPAKRVLALTVDALLCALTVWIAMSLRYETWINPREGQWLAIGLSPALALPIFVVNGLYRAIFRYAGWSALMTVIRAVAIYGLLYAMAFTLISVPGVPRTVGLLQPMLLLLAVGGSRLVARYWLSGLYQSKLQRAQLPRVLIYGAGAAGRQLADALTSSHEMQAVGFLDDDARLHGQTLSGLPIHDPHQLESCVQKLRIHTILLAVPSATRQRRNDILLRASRAQVSVRTLPNLLDLAQGRVQVSDLRELDIEDLLGRDPVAPDTELLHRHVRAKVVLVTGAGGSIGSELCRQILQGQPRVLLLLDLNEFALYQIHQELQGWQQLQAGGPEASPTQLLPLLASVQDADRLGEIMATWRPHTIYHAAAYKHVPLVEHNPAEGLKNNVWGTWTCARVAQQHGVERFVLISTDKAVRPTNIMGASKRLAEMVLQGLAADLPEAAPGSTRRGAQAGRTCFSMVRFGNVLGSSGSVVPLFRRQIKSGGPITLTHPDITRYFMTIPEAAQLVIQAGAMARGGDVFLLDMGQPVRIQDLARKMVELSGLTIRDERTPDGDIEIEITGLRPGEKLYEELLIGEHPEPTQHPRIMKAREDFLPWPELQHRLASLREALNRHDALAIRTQMVALVTGYEPSDPVVDWTHLAQRGAATQPVTRASQA
ncbi:nucleoside-diphosphate sugar epimerase/dehydratase [Curvibacter sp. HBC28]|uniref:Nucleoside-diphosphate sugar epimerase/dehydratase n=1 Tax=Curvibacter microcysteis TaxID=3026419 RepID=A0ABT5MHP5_9BURK|nr:nucleoside-diphosphate sugar epimerase/dehydratase [Curvibacter sp. HBC28]MDD0815402.1 nucleoside-diphosphate sugar epimerase/dehydratase [Curvibacter sp. HBC28]